jgi:hypothetical protein
MTRYWHGCTATSALGEAIDALVITCDIPLAKSPASARELK